MTLHIDPEFRALIPPPTPAERQQLEANLLADGCRDPLVTWHGVLLDGHTRFEICTARGIPFQTVEQSCADRNEALLWILQQQLGRRNLNDYQRAELVLRLEPLIAAQTRERMISTLKHQPDASVCSVEQTDGQTAERLARIAGISTSGMRRAMKVQKSGSPELQAQVRNNEVSLSAAAENCYAGRTGPLPPRTKPSAPPILTPAHRKEERTLAGRLSTLLAELRRQRKANHDDLKTRRWIPGNIVTRLQTEQLNWIETELEHLVVELRATAADVPYPRAKTARASASTGDNGHG